MPPKLATASQITQFILAPHKLEASNTSAGIFSRAFAALRSTQPTADYSFTLSTLPTTTASSISSPALQNHTHLHLQPPLPRPLLTFQDTTSAFSASTSGIIELDLAAAQMLGVHSSFWITMALAYLEFQEDREVRRPGTKWCMLTTITGLSCSCGGVIGTIVDILDDVVMFT
jgi:hypothetical protein